jgi:hypothetical protein
MTFINWLFNCFVPFAIIFALSAAVLTVRDFLRR